MLQHVTLGFTNWQATVQRSLCLGGDIGRNPLYQRPQGSHAFLAAIEKPFDLVGQVEHVGQGALAELSPPVQPPDRRCYDQERQAGYQDGEHFEILKAGRSLHQPGKCRQIAVSSGMPAWVAGQMRVSPCHGWGFGLTRPLPSPYNRPLMSATLPAVLDVWRMVSAKRYFEGTLPLAAFTRLRDSLVDTEGDCRFSLEFGHDVMNQAFVEVCAEADLPLQCQRTMERYLQPVKVRQQLGLVTSEAQEAALPEGMEPLLVPESAELRAIDLVEDELILALPVVPINPESSLPDTVWPLEDEEKPNPFAALSALKDHKK